MFPLSLDGSFSVSSSLLSYIRSYLAQMGENVSLPYTLLFHVTKSLIAKANFSYNFWSKLFLGILSMEVDDLIWEDSVFK